ncbi:MAG TPA: hypothetical protein PK156_36295 [Polyangium sp.]|nr:hypothetical protein [Polyangium sp.]
MRPRNVAIFTEGSDYTDLRGRKPLIELWRELCNRLYPTSATFHIYGISKAQIVALGEPPKTPGSREALDVFIERMYQKYAFDVIIVAFDRIPKNQLVPFECMRAEINFILERFVARKYLAPELLDSGQALLEHYANNPGCSRDAGRPPRGMIDVLYMDPMFEALLVMDESAVMRALGLKRRPKDWPKFDPSNLHPDSNILAHAVKFASEDIRRLIRGDMKSHKHDWALQIIRSADTDARIFQHPIAQRLRTLLM